MSVYTKTGDKGVTATFSGKRVSKSSQLIRTIGTIDELNSYLGIVKGLVDIQRNLFTINAILTGAKLTFSDKSTKELEKQIDKIEASIPVQKNFLIYGGSKKASELFFARAICRRAERELTSLKKLGLVVSDSLFAYINRLSDYLFVKARQENYKVGKREFFWRPNVSSRTLEQVGD